jgi:hypothetical protein
METTSARRLWALASLLKAKAIRMQAQAGTALSDAEEKEAETEAGRLNNFGEFCHSLFWMQCHIDTGCWTENIGVRAGWMIVTSPSQSGPPAMLKALFGGAMGE